MKKIYISLLAILCFALGLGLWYLIDYSPSDKSAVEIGQPAPKFFAPILTKPESGFTDQDLRGHYSLVNFWASWCYSCIYEHKLLEKIKQSNDIQLYGINYMDSTEQAEQFLQTYGNPYTKVAEDQSGHLGIIWGVYGTPESFVINPQGIIVFHQTGPITPEIWNNKIKPLLR